MDGSRTSTMEREYLAKAEEAEDRAREFQDPYLRASWESIAAGYRELAARQGRLN